MTWVNPATAALGCSRKKRPGCGELVRAEPFPFLGCKTRRPSPEGPSPEAGLL